MLAFASRFVLDACGPRVAFGVSDDEDEEEPDEQDTSMDLDKSYDERDEEHENMGEEDHTVSDEKEALSPNIGHLAVWADMFLDDHLRMLPPFGEIWFLDDHFAINVATGYNQTVAMEEDGKA